MSHHGMAADGRVGVSKERRIAMLGQLSQFTIHCIMQPSGAMRDFPSPVSKEQRGGGCIRCILTFYRALSPPWVGWL